jgi:NADH:ubiquinone oxidoreductase subunit 3 (subunit A)
MAFVVSSVVIIALVTVMYLVSFWASASNLSSSSRTIDKLSAYECGLEPVGDARMKFEILYYVIGILYLIFDLEIMFLFPAGVALLFTLNLVAFWVVMLFVIILTI